MAELILDYYKNEDLYSDGAIEEEILRLAREGKRPEELADCAYPVLYHLSHIRENILAWYPFPDGCRVLEIGAGCGALTGLLTKKAGYVAAVDLSKRRSTVNFERHKDAENLELFVGNLNDMTFPEPFDFIILNGVFEYAMSFTEGPTPYLTFLRNLKRHLASAGKVIIAIENKYGLKYFAGAPEDHTDKYFLGLNDYADNRSVRTFGKEELSDLLRDAGLSRTKFYYPYPDYKFPMEIFTDEGFAIAPYGRAYHNLNGNRLSLFDERKVAKGLSREGVIAAFANSFLVVASAEGIDDDTEIRYVRMSNDRKDAYAVSTVIRETGGKRIVIKYPMTEDAADHIRHMKEAAMRPEAASVLSQDIAQDEGVYAYDYIEGHTLDHVLVRAYEKDGSDAVCRMIRDFFDVAFKDVTESLAAGQYGPTDFSTVFGEIRTSVDEPCVHPANIDLIFDNVFPEEDGYKVIDHEWLFDFPVPVRFIKWRALDEFANRHPEIIKAADKPALMEQFGIDAEAVRIFEQWNTHFCIDYVGAGTLARFDAANTVVGADELLRSNRAEGLITSYLYVDTGEGYSETQKLSAPLKKRGERFVVEFDLSSYAGVKRLRFDPIEQQLIRLSLDVTEPGDAVSCTGTNGKKIKDEWIRFMTFDPQIEFTVSGEIQTLTIEGRFAFLTDEDLNRRHLFGN